MGKEQRKEYQDHLVIRTFAVFLNALKEQSFKKRMEKDRRVEDLVLIFVSNATKELSKGKGPDSDSWLLMVDRHVALFVRLISLILKDQDWAKDRPELMGRLTVLEGKLLAHDQDLTDEKGVGAVADAPVPLSYDVKEMPLVQVVAKIFGITLAQAQSDINRNKSVWTEKAALQDLKAYQAHLNLKTGTTLSREDFESEDAYEIWKKGEGPDLSQMMLAIVQSNPDLARSTPQANNDSNVPELTRQLSDMSNRTSFVIDQPMDLSSLSFSDPADVSESVYTFTPSDPRSFYRFILAQALTYDIREQKLEAAEADVPAMKLLSRQSTELLNEICLRWRIPSSSRIVLFLDIVHEKFVDQDIDMGTLDSAFVHVKEAPVQESKKRNSSIPSSIFDRKKWTIYDITLMQRLLSSLHEALLRELYDNMMHCYDAKPQPLGPVMYILDNHIRLDPSFKENPEDYDRFRSYVHDGLLGKAKECYQDLLHKEIPAEQEAWESCHVIQLAQGVTKLTQKIQKRYRNNPEIMGYVNSPLFSFFFFGRKFVTD